MERGTTTFTAVVALATAGCAAEQANVDFRVRAAPVSASAKPVPARIADANAQLALGNAALALESYRKALRDDPQSTDAMLGAARCYDMMARFDVSRRYYESALAILPKDAGLLTAFAQSLDLQGMRTEATAVRGEIALAQAEAAPAAAAPASPVIAAIAAAALPKPASSVTIKLPPAREYVPEASAPLTVDPVSAPAYELAAAQEAVVVAEPVSAPAPVPVTIAEPVKLAPPAPAPLAPAREPFAVAAVRTPAALLTPAQPAPAAKVERPVKPAPAPVRVPEDEQPLLAEKRATARLERVSLGEVALVTAGRPRWQPVIAKQTAQSTTIRFVPLRQAQASNSGIKVLNAARHDGLAARTRNLLADRGWRRIAIGNALHARERTLILYPESRRALAMRLAAQFNFAVARPSSRKDVLVLLGRDAIRQRRRTA